MLSILTTNNNDIHFIYDEDNEKSMKFIDHLKRLRDPSQRDPSQRDPSLRDPSPLATAVRVREGTKFKMAPLQ